MSVDIKRIKVTKEVCKALGCRLTGVIIPIPGLAVTSSPKFEKKGLMQTENPIKHDHMPHNFKVKKDQSSNNLE